MLVRHLTPDWYKSACITVQSVLRRVVRLCATGNIHNNDLVTTETPVTIGRAPQHSTKQPNDLQIQGARWASYLVSDLVPGIGSSFSSGTTLVSDLLPSFYHVLPDLRLACDKIWYSFVLTLATGWHQPK